MKKDLHYYAKKFAKLRVDRSRGIAPHKPILVLSVIEIIGQNIIQQNRIILSPELIASFLKYWSVLVSSDKHHSDIHLPFFYLRGEGFWHLKVDSRFDDIVTNFKPNSINSVRQIVEYIYLDDELFDLLQIDTNRSYLVKILVDKWFADRKEKIDELFQINAFRDFQDRLRESGGEVYSIDDIKDDAKTLVRDAAFRRNILSLYNYSCAFCRLRVISGSNQSIVDGAHIKPFAEFWDDRLNNGLSLCKNHHWAFDRGWFTIGDDYKIIVSEDLQEHSPNSKPLKAFENEQIYLPSQSAHLPRLEAIRWHREKRFAVRNQIVLKY